MSTQGSCGITKRTLNLIPVLDILAGTREKMILYLFNHLSNKPVFRFKIIIGFLPNNCQSLKPVDAIANRSTSLQIKRPNLLPIKMHEVIQLGSTLISDFKPGPQADSVRIPFMHRPPKQQVICRHLKYHFHPGLLGV